MKLVPRFVKTESFFSFLIAFTVFFGIIWLSFKTQQDRILSISVILCAPILLYEIGKRLREFYLDQFDKYEKFLGILEPDSSWNSAKADTKKEPPATEKTVEADSVASAPAANGKQAKTSSKKQTKEGQAEETTAKATKQGAPFNRRALSFGIRCLYSFTFVVIIFIIGFFSFETVESSYYGSKKMHNMEQRIVAKLQEVILDQFCCPKKSIKRSTLRDYIYTQLSSSLRKQENNSQSAYEDLIQQTLQVVTQNKGFEYDEEQDTFTWKFDELPAVNTLEFLDDQDMHDRIQTFFRQITKGFGLTHE